MIQANNFCVVTQEEVSGTRKAGKLSWHNSLFNVTFLGTEEFIEFFQTEMRLEYKEESSPCANNSTRRNKTLSDSVRFRAHSCPRCGRTMKGL